MRREIVYAGPSTALPVVSEVLADFDVTCIDEAPTSLAVALRDAHGYIDATTWLPLDLGTLDEAKNLSVISLASTGDNHIDRRAADRLGIPVRTLSDDPALIADLPPTAEHTWALILACARRIPFAHQDVVSGSWNRQAFAGTMLSGRQLGVVGCGRLGTRVAGYAIAFGMNVVGYDPYVDDWPLGVAAVNLPQLFSTSDVISLHVPLNAETSSMVNSTLLGQVKHGAIFVNTSRGGLVDEVALLEALCDARIGSAGLDVLDGEPFVAEHPLVAYARHHDNLVLTPHLGGFVSEAVNYACRIAAERVAEHFNSCEGDDVG